MFGNNKEQVTVLPGHRYSLVNFKVFKILAAIFSPCLFPSTHE
jgi:hypothetical protein